MSFIGDKIKALTNQLYPTGRAFSIPVNSDKEKLIDGLNASEERFYDDAISLFDSVLPDNNNFTSDDATDWEVRLGLPSNPLVSLADRKLAIIRKMNHPGTIKARQNYLYLQKQLQDAGFPVWVYENRFGTDYPLLAATSWSDISAWTSKTSTDFVLSSLSGASLISRSWIPCVVKAGQSISFTINFLRTAAQATVYFRLTDDAQALKSNTVTYNQFSSNGNKTVTLTATSDSTRLEINGLKTATGAVTVSLVTAIGTVLITSYNPYSTKTPSQFSTTRPFPHGAPLYGLGIQYGQGFHYGTGFYNNKIVNSIYDSVDLNFNIGNSYNFTFFIGSNLPGYWATVDKEREIEFRQLVLKIKPVNTVAFLLVDFY